MKKLPNSILVSLQKDHRITIGQLAEINHVSPTTVRKYLNQLQATVLKNYTIRINPNHLGNFRRIIVRLKTNPRESSIVNTLIQHPQCQVLQGITGEYSIFALFQINTQNGFNQLVNFLDQIISGTNFQKYHLIELINTFKTNDMILPLQKSTNKTGILDILDVDILSALQHQGNKKKTVSEIARRLNQPQPTIFHRIEHLIQQGTILKFTVDLKPNPTSFNTILQIKVASDNMPSLGNRLAQNPFITDLYRTSEDYALLAHVNTPSVEKLNQTLVQIYHEYPQVIDTNTTFVLNTFKRVNFPILSSFESRRN